MFSRPSAISENLRSYDDIFTLLLPTNLHNYERRCTIINPLTDVLLKNFYKYLHKTQDNTLQVILRFTTVHTFKAVNDGETHPP